MKENLCVTRKCQKKSHLHKILMTMKLIILLFLMTICQLMAFESYSQATNITLQLDDAKIKDVLVGIEDKSEFLFLYNSKLIDVDRRVSLNCIDKSISEVLEELFKGTDVGYAVVSNQIVLTNLTSNEVFVNLQSQQLSLTGKVTDENGNPFPGVNVQIEGTTIGTITDIDGKFIISSPEPNAVLIFSFLGYSTQRINVAGRAIIDLTMIPETKSLEEVVVIGYGTQKKSDLTGAITSVSTSELIGQPFSNVNQALQGKVAGANFIATSGEPGSQVSVRIRGQGTFSSSGPLYIVDGTPITSMDINSLNMNDIESLNVLKDASAAAIYGSRAANGVIIITTKRGLAGRPTVTLNSYYGLQLVTKNRYIPMANSLQLAECIVEGDLTGGYTPQGAFTDPENLKTNTNWQKEAFPVAPMTDHTLNVSGGNENAKFSISGSYLDQQGSMVFSYFTRYSARINSDFNIGKRLTIGESLSMSRSKGLNLGYGTNLDLAYLLGSSPTMKLYNPENLGGYGGPNAAETGVNNRSNIIGTRDLQRHYSWNNNILGSAFGELKILPGLKYRLNLGLRNGLNTTKYYLGLFDMDNRSNTVRSLSQSKEESYEYLIENTLSYEKIIDDKLSLNLLAGYTQQDYFASSMGGTKKEFADDALQVINAGTGASTVSGNEAEWALQSYLGRANITLLEKYLFTATIRRDGSSRFGRDNRFGIFPSLALGWNINKENFMQNIPSLSVLKLRGSWGRLGNQEIGNYGWQTTIATTPQYILGSSQAVIPAAAVLNLGNPALMWETTSQTNLGIDLGLFGDAFTFSADYWIKNTDGILLQIPISVATGIYRQNGAYQNAASVRNSGFEFLVGYRKAGRVLDYGVNAELSTVKNEVTDLGGVPYIINEVTNVYAFGTSTITEIGRPMSTYYGYIFDGIFQNQGEVDDHATQTQAAPGEARIKDLNNDGVINSSDRTYIGDPFPNFTYSLSGNVQYKNFDLNIGFQGVQGKQLYNAQRMYLESMSGEWGQMATIVNRWKGEGTSNTLPQARRGSRSVRSLSLSKFVENASFLRLQNLQIGYSLPSELCSKLGMQQLRVYFNGQNLMTITEYINYNPEILGGSGYNNDSMNPLAMGVDMGSVPIPAVLQFGLQVSF